MKTQSCLQYYGSDASVAQEIAKLLDHCRHVTIPFCGGLGILPHLQARAILANDKNGNAINFYQVLKNEKLGPDLIKACKQTLCHPSELKRANKVDQHSGTKLDLAWAYWTRCWLGRKGQGGTEGAGKSASIRRNASGGSNASRIKAAAADLNQWCELFHKCEFEDKDFRVILSKGHDRRDGGYYIDAPWVNEGKLYEETFVEQDHRDLAAGLSRFKKSTVVVRYGDAPLVRDLYPTDHWTWIEAESRTQARQSRLEFWLVNNRQ